MPKSLRRSWISSSRLSDATSRPSTSITPAVGSISRFSMRTRVDFPEPDSPITTKTSPSRTVKLASSTPITLPVRA